MAVLWDDTIFSMAFLSLLIGGLAALFFFLLYTVVRFIRDRHSLSDIRGPENSSFWIGSEQDIRFQKEVGDVEFAWLREYGSAWRVFGSLGEQTLMIADPKALQYILHTSGYRFPKRPEMREGTRLILGEGLVWADGDTHGRQRKIILPAFSAPQLKSFLSLFQRHGVKLVQKWKDEISSKDASGKGSMINIAPWLSRTTLDVIGAAGFNYDFGSLDDAKTELSEVYKNLLLDTALYPWKIDILFRSLWKYMPETPLHYFARNLPTYQYTRLRRYTNYMRRFAVWIIRKNELISDGKDIISVLARANESENPKAKMSDKEVYDQINTLMFAGHDTISNTLMWFFYEIAQDQVWQRKIREEIATTRAKVIARGDEDFSIGDLEGMTTLQAALKESMRLHPIVWQIARCAAKDDIIPLAYPITTRSGKVIDKIPVQKGQNITISICGYNRMKEIWGENADEWHPERFLNLDKSKQTSIGVHANLLNFSAGIRACIGWRFAVIELQALTAALLENFEFAQPDEAEKKHIYRRPAGLMLPVIDGHHGSWMGLKVKSVR